MEGPLLGDESIEVYDGLQKKELPAGMRKRVFVACSGSICGRRIKEQTGEWCKPLAENPYRRLQRLWCQQREKSQATEVETIYRG